MELCCFFKVMISFRCKIWLYTLLGMRYDEVNKSGFEKVSEWDTTIQDTMEEYDNVER